MGTRRTDLTDRGQPIGSLLFDSARFALQLRMCALELATVPEHSQQDETNDGDEKNFDARSPRQGMLVIIQDVSLERCLIQ